MTKSGYDVFYIKIFQNNLSNTIKCENKCFYLYSNSGFEYRIKKMKSGYTTFWNQTSQSSNSLELYIMIKALYSCFHH